MPAFPPRTGTKKPQLTNNAKAILAIVGLFLLVMVVMPRWRRATACTLGGGKWTADINALTKVGCVKKSKTAGQPCTGQIRDECDHALCDLQVKPAGNTSSGGSCPNTYVKYFYNNEGSFYKK